MNREIERIIKRNKYRSKFYEIYKKPSERESSRRRSFPTQSPNDENTESQPSLRIPFQFQVLAAVICLLLGMIIKKDPKLSPVHDYVFTQINLKRIEVTLTKTIGTIFPTIKPNDDLEVNLPVITLETTRNYGNGVIVQTELYAGVESHVDGTVIQIKKDRELGDIIVIQDVDGNEWEYGLLTDRKVNIYDRIHRGELLGMAKTTSDYEGGEFYLAIKNRSEYLDVIDLVNTYD